VQVRLAGGTEDRRLVRSVYLDQVPRDVTVNLDDMRAAGTGQRAELNRAEIASLLFVVDTVNARPGAAGSFWIEDVRAESAAQVRTVRSK